MRLTGHVANGKGFGVQPRMKKLSVLTNVVRDVSVQYNRGEKRNEFVIKSNKMFKLSYE